MISAQKVRGVSIGTGIPKICVPLTGTTVEKLLEEVALLQTDLCDMIEWRADYFEHVAKPQAVVKMLELLRSHIDDLPLLFTLRTKGQGGEFDGADIYKQLLHRVIPTSHIDIVDIELSIGQTDCRQLIEYAHKHNILAMLSFHDFQKTPPQNELIAMLNHMCALEADLPKIAVMPQNDADVLSLLCATDTFCRHGEYNRAAVTISMGELGCVSRVMGEICGSALTFGVLKNTSAPGQLAVKVLREALVTIHNSANLSVQDIDLVRKLLQNIVI